MPSCQLKDTCWGSLDILTTFYKNIKTIVQDRLMNKSQTISGQISKLLKIIFIENNITSNSLWYSWYVHSLALITYFYFLFFRRLRILLYHIHQLEELL